MLLVRLHTDERIIRKAMQGHRGALEELVQRHLPLVHAVAHAHVRRRADAEDVVQDTFLSALSNLGALKDPKKFAAWICTIARNRARHIGREADRESRTLDSMARFEPRTGLRDAARDELHALLRARLMELPPMHREVLLLHYFAGKTTREIADLFGVGTEAVKKRLQRARQALGEHLSEDLHDLLTTAKPAKEQSAQILLLLGKLNPLDATIAAAGGASQGGSTVVITALKMLGAAAILGGVVVTMVQDNPPDTPRTPPEVQALVSQIENRLEGVNEYSLTMDITTKGVQQEREYELSFTETQQFRRPNLFVSRLEQRKHVIPGTEGMVMHTILDGEWWWQYQEVRPKGRDGVRPAPRIDKTRLEDFLGAGFHESHIQLAGFLLDPFTWSDRNTLALMNETDDAWTFEAKPNLVWPMEPDTTRVTTNIGKSDCAIREVQMETKSGETTRIVVRDVKLNPGVTDETFVFTPPTGVAVSDGTQSMIESLIRQRENYSKTLK